MNLTFVGAAHEVTGSCHYIEACGKHILIDCGMEQGKDVFENIPIPVEEALIDYVFLTHAHVDHSGNLPLIYSKGFRGKVFTTFRCRKQSGKIERQNVHQEWKRLCHYILWKMPTELLKD